MKRIVLAAVIASAVSSALVAQLGIPSAVSPGARDHVVVSPTACPLFSWASPVTHDRVELAIVATDTGRIVSEVRLPGGARAWRPAAGECLERGATYAWSIRAVSEGDSGAWAEPLLFEVSARPSQAAVLEAAEVLNAWLEAVEDGRLGAAAETEGPASPTPRISIDPDVTAVSAFFETLSGTEVTVGVHGVSHSTTAGSAGAVGEARAATGNVAGVIGQVASSGSIGGVFDNVGGGVVLETRSSGTPLMRINGSGTVFAPLFTGKGSGLTGVEDLECTECVDGSDLVDETITYFDLGVDSVGQAKIAPDAVGNAELAPDSVGAAEIAAGAVTTVKIADDAVGDAPLVSTHFAVGAVTSSKIASGAVTSLKIDADAVTRSKLQGSEKRIRLIHPDCPDADVLTFETQCTSSVCDVSPSTKFLDCSGNCTETSPVICTNPPTGWLLDPTMGP